MTDKAQTRADRLKAALRDNLKKRKAQARGRRDERGPTQEPHAGPEETEPREG